MFQQNKQVRIRLRSIFSKKLSMILLNIGNYIISRTGSVSVAWLDSGFYVEASRNCYF